MADTKISELPVATAIASPDVAPVVQGGVTKQADVSLFGNLVASLILRSNGDSNSRQNSGTLIIGQAYLIYVYSSGDDFTNVGANSNASGVSFTATGTTPANWTNSSILYSHPYTYLNSGIIVKDANNVEILRLWADDPVNSNNLFIGKVTVDGYPGTDNIIIGREVMTLDAGQNNTVIGGLLDHTLGDQNVLIGGAADLNEDGDSNAVAIGAGSSTGNQSTAIGAAAQSLGINSVAIGFNVTANDNDQISIGGDADFGDHTATLGSATTTDVYFATGGDAILHGKGDAMVFPDSDPHIVGAGYWLAGVLTRSNG